MNTVHLYEFLALAESLSYSKTAKALYIAQSVLSRHMKELEEELGMPLMIRNSHGVSLTEAGRVLAQEGPALLREYDGAVDRLRSRQLSRQSRLRIGMGLEFSYSRHISSFLRHFAREYPDIELIYDVHPGSTPSQVAMGYDLFFTPCAYPDLPSGVKELLVERHSIYAVLPPEHPLMTKASISLYQLRGETIVVPYADELFGPYAQNYLLAERATKGQISCIKVDNLSTAVFLVQMEKGICLAPHYVRSIIPSDAFASTISDPNCKFAEYLYCFDPENEAAELFFREFSQAVAARRRDEL